MMTYDRYISTMLALSLGLSCAPAALAGEQGSDGDEIIVTATRGNTRAENVAARADVVTRDDIERKGYLTTVDALKAVPGLSVVQSGGAGALTSVFSRGTNSKHTLALYDGIRLNDASSPNGQFNFGSDALGDLERVEVLRGPASAIYGSDAIGGVINFIPRVGGARAFMPYGEVSAGNLDTYHVMGGARGTTGPLGYALTGEYFETGGFNNTAARIADNLGERDGSHFASITGNATLAITGGLSIRGLARYRKAKAYFDDAALDRIGRGGRDRYFIWRVAPRYVALGGRYQGDLEIGQVDNKRSEWNLTDANAVGGADTAATGLRTFAAWRNRLELHPSDAVKTTLSAGIEWQKDRVTATDAYSSPLVRSEKQTAFYGLAQIGVADRLDLNGSIRHDDPQFFDAVTTWNAGAVLHLPEIGGRAYVAYGTSFKAPALAERFTKSAYNVGNPLLRPEHGKSFEAGVDVGTRLGAAGWVGLTGTYFDTRIRDLIEYSYADLANINVGSATIKGYELSFKGRAGTFLDLSVNYTYTDALNGTTGARLLRRPKHSWSGSVTVTPVEAFSLTGEYFRRGVRDDVTYASTSLWGKGGGYLGNGTVPGYDIVNFSARYRVTGAVELFASLRNAFDVKYEEPDSYAGAPRTWLVGARARL